MYYYGAFAEYTARNLFFYPFPSYIIPTEGDPYQIDLKKEQYEDMEYMKQNTFQQSQAFEKQIYKKHKQSKSNLWTQQEDDLLLDMIKEQKCWQQIAQKLPGKNVLVCQRRYKRLIKLSLKWPKQNQALIKHLHQVQKLPWREIQKQLPHYTKKQIKERYKNFLQVEVKRALWTLEEDLQLRRLVKNYGNNWVRFTKLFQGRSQLQLKNRYNKFIKPIQEKIFSKENDEKSSAIGST